MAHVIKVISFVPSWTETLIEAGVDVVGRTRYCIHPAHKAVFLPVVGGTKKIMIENCKALNPDFISFDREENNLEMTQLCDEYGLKWIATHVVDLRSCGESLLLLSRKLNNKQLADWGQAYLDFSALNLSYQQRKKLYRSMLLESSNDQFLNLDFVHNQTVKYLIWRKPLMMVSRDTFIGSMLAHIGLNVEVQNKRYPQLEENSLLNSFCLFSSEPYPFEKDYRSFMDEGVRGVLVDGEKLSWYGIRALRFLESAL